MDRFEATPTPALLIWARETAGMSVEVAAQKAKVSVEQLSSWEEGSARPSIPQLRKLASCYKRPLAAFYLPEPPLRFQVMHDFRRLSAEGAATTISPKLTYEIRRAHDRREWALEMIEDIDEPIPAFEAAATLRDGIEEVAGRMRRAMRVSLADQTQGRSDGEAFKWWRSLLENAGILTLQATTLQLEEARGFSISTKPLPVVVVNIKDAPRGRIFTLLHEVTHILLSEGGICDLHDGDTESFCNQVAGAALFPKEALLDTSVVRRHKRGDPTWTDLELTELSRQFGGSREAALVRLLTLKLTTQPFYDRAHSEFLRQYRQLQEQRQDAEGFAPPYVVAISSAGPLFTGLVVENFNREKITASDVSDYLQIRLKHLKELQGEFSKGA
jgi:Zn-dependent peptidase ImmA (M78 family)/DNA-binding XRE family transcriptional regulator